MTKNVTKNPARMTPDAYMKLQDVPANEILNQVRTGQLQVPKSDYAEFRQFAAMTPDKRKVFVEGKKGTLPAPDSTTASAAGTQMSGSQPDINPPAQGAAQSGSNANAAQSGAKPDGSEFLVELSNLNKTLGEQRAKNGQLGQTVKTLKQQNEELQKRLKEFEANKEIPGQAPVEKNLPDMPIIPDASTFVEGVYDDGYKSAMTKYQQDIKDWQGKFQSFVTSVKPKWAEELATTVASVRDQANVAAEFVNNTTQQQEAQRVHTALSDMWADIKAMQQATGLKTSIPIDVINQNQLIVNAEKALNPDGTPVYSPEEVAAAKRLIGAIPKSEYEAYAKVCKIVPNLYVFDAVGMPKKISEDLDSDLAWTRAIRKSGVPGIQAIVPMPPSNSQMVDRLSAIQQNMSAAPQMMNGSNLGGGDAPLNDQTTRTEKMTKLSEMARRFNSNRSLGTDKKFMDEMDKLRSELGFPARK